MIMCRALLIRCKCTLTTWRTPHLGTSSDTDTLYDGVCICSCRHVVLPAAGLHRAGQVHQGGEPVPCGACGPPWASTAASTPSPP